MTETEFQCQWGVGAIHGVENGVDALPWLKLVFSKNEVD